MTSRRKLIAMANSPTPHLDALVKKIIEIFMGHSPEPFLDADPAKSYTCFCVYAAILEVLPSMEQEAYLAALLDASVQLDSVKQLLEGLLPIRVQLQLALGQPVGWPEQPQIAEDLTKKLCDRKPTDEDSIFREFCDLLEHLIFDGPTEAEDEENRRWAMVDQANATA